MVVGGKIVKIVMRFGKKMGMRETRAILLKLGGLSSSLVCQE